MRVVAVFGEKAPQLVSEPRPRRLALEQNVIPAFERYEARVREKGCQLAALAKCGDGVSRRMQYECGHFHQRDQLRYINRRRG